MTEQEFKSKLTRLLANPPTSTYASTSGGTCEGVDYYKWEVAILALLKETGWLSPEMLVKEGYYQAVPFNLNEIRKEKG